jgi:hypothetical protein
LYEAEKGESQHKDYASKSIAHSTYACVAFCGYGPFAASFYFLWNEAFAAIYSGAGTCLNELVQYLSGTGTTQKSGFTIHHCG